MEETAEYKLVVERVKSLMARRPKHRSYQNHYKKFVRFVIENDLRGDDLTFIHRESVDRYFQEAVVLRTCGKPTTSRIIPSLQWFYRNLENPGGTFVVKNSITEEALNQQQENRNDTPRSTIFSCPHKGLKDVLSERDKKKIVSYIMLNRKDSGSLTCSFCLGNQAGVRGASTRKCGYSELYISAGFGPGKEGPRALVPLVVLRTGLMNKDRFTSDRMVGCWRHREPLLCAQGHLALHVLNDLRQDDDINFFHNDLTKPADWWLKPLVEYDSLNDEAGPMAEVYKATGVDGCKLTHNRTYAVQQAGSEGLAPYQINSMTKHVTDKMHKCYLAEVDKEACKVMAGFSKDEAYFVEREFLEPIWTIDSLIDVLLPKYRTWVRQHESPQGDKTRQNKKRLK